MERRFRWHGSLGVIAVALSLAATGSASGQALPAPGVVEGDLVVTAGEGIVKVAPDRAFVTIAAESRAKAPRDAQKQNAAAMAEVQRRLREVGFGTETIRTLGYDLQPEFDYVSGRQVPRGYLARNTIEVRVDAIARVGEVIDAAVGSGATSVRDIRFDLKDRDAVSREALKQAVVEARHRAEAIAVAAARAIDRIVRIEEQGAVFTPPPRMMAARVELAEAAPAPPPPVVAGELEVRARVSLTARLK